MRMCRVMCEFFSSHFVGIFYCSLHFPMRAPVPNVAMRVVVCFMLSRMYDCYFGILYYLGRGNHASTKSASAYTSLNFMRLSQQFSHTENMKNINKFSPKKATQKHCKNNINRYKDEEEEENKGSNSFGQ